MTRSLALLITGITVSISSLGCAGMMAGSSAWFDRQRPDLETKASADLACTGKPIAFAAAKGDDYREVEARGCGKKVSYTYVKVGPVSSWKGSDVSAE